MRNALDDQMEEMHGLFVAHFQKNKRMQHGSKFRMASFVGISEENFTQERLESREVGKCPRYEENTVFFLANGS